MDVSGQFKSLVVLTVGKNRVPTTYVAGWVSEHVWTFRGIEKSPANARIQTPDFTACSGVSIRIALLGHSPWP